MELFITNHPHSADTGFHEEFRRRGMRHLVRKNFDKFKVDISPCKENNNMKLRRVHMERKIFPYTEISLVDKSRILGSVFSSHCAIQRRSFCCVKNFVIAPVKPCSATSQPNFTR